MAARLKLNVDWYNKVLIKGARDSGLFVLPKFYQGDIIPMQVTIYEPVENTISRYSQVDIENVALKLAVSETPTGTPTLPAPFVTQFDWPKNLTGGNKYFYADVAFNTAELDLFLGSAAEKTDAYMELEITEGSAITTIWQGAITIRAQVIETGTGSVAAGETPLSLEVAKQLFVKKMMDPGEQLIIPSASGIKRTILYTDNDGSFHSDVI